ncbi:MAG: hydantoinase B/oxoprolinase family protein, partial [Burkholderiaceae bacterium]
MSRGARCRARVAARLRGTAANSGVALRVKSYGYQTDFGGAGEFRGGLGLRRVHEVMGEASFNGLTARSVCRSRGLS